MALAICWHGLIRVGVARDQAALARLVGVSRARIPQVMDLLRLAQRILEAVLFLPCAPRSRDPADHGELEWVAAEPRWREMPDTVKDTARASCSPRCSSASRSGCSGVVGSGGCPTGRSSRIS